MSEANLKLFAARAQKGWTQEEAAEALGVDRKTYNRWENGKFYPKARLQKHICEIFNMSPEALGFSDTNARKEDKKEAIDVPFLSGLKMAQILSTIENADGNSLFQNIFQQKIDERLKELHTLTNQQGMEERFTYQKPILIAIAAMPTLQVNRSEIIDIEAFLLKSLASISSCWYLLKYDGILNVEQILLKVVPLLAPLASKASKYQIIAASVIAQANIMLALTSKHQLKADRIKRFCKEAIRYSYLAKDNILTAAATLYLRDAYLLNATKENIQQAIEISLQALHVLGNEKTILKSNIALILAEMYVQVYEKEKALEYLALAQNSFHDTTEQDPSYITADYGLYSLYQGEGNVYLKLAELYSTEKYYEKAWDILGKNREIPFVSERATNLTIIYQASTSVGLRDLGMYTNLLQEGAQMALKIGSRKRYDEISEVFISTPDKWRNTKQIKFLAKNIFNQLNH